MSEVPLPSSFDDNHDFYEESRPQKLIRRLREEPLIPFGCALTIWALIGASKAMRKGDHHQTNRMFRRRIYAQGFTLVAIVAGSFYWQSDRVKRKEFEAVVKEKADREKHAKWIAELEARDRENQEIKSLRRAAKEKREKQLAEKFEEKTVGVLDAVKEAAEKKK
ncbi:altered inheritance of mitochondria protein 31, mitochondrial [Patellaria atrata CBS 101060]|uniref:Altered inheritance of mitochondria protein 31, mitochondrial n=1 Tax=Patellaria atrata CBS 101060 TaxID=1346257 RepID=A0A9P4VSH8_9PEZI|nr:altered inheritance of mitochondria protein 31, mitochondrial [Patellaria atrata CBS 101060]